MADGHPDEGGLVVVGVDGSASSKQALRWAARQARLTGAVVLAVIAWEYPALCPSALRRRYRRGRRHGAGPDRAGHAGHGSGG